MGIEWVSSGYHAISLKSNWCQIGKSDSVTRAEELVKSNGVTRGGELVESNSVTRGTSQVIDPL